MALDEPQGVWIAYWIFFGVAIAIGLYFIAAVLIDVFQETIFTSMLTFDAPCVFAGDLPLCGDGLSRA